MEEERKALIALDIQMPVDTEIKSEGVAYYRLPDGLHEFLKLCMDKHGILGFEYDGSRNFGVILRNPENHA